MRSVFVKQKVARMNEQGRNLSLESQIQEACERQDAAAVIGLFRDSHTLSVDAVEAGEEILNTRLSLAEQHYIHLLFFEKMSARINGTMALFSDASDTNPGELARCQEAINQDIGFNRETISQLRAQSNSEVEFNQTHIAGLLASPNEHMRKFAMGYIAQETGLSSVRELTSAVADTSSAITDHLWDALSLIESSSSASASQDEKLEIVAEVKKCFAKIAEELQIAIDGLQPEYKSSEEDVT